ncbi:MAG TPA: hypothetical protein VF480_07360 [Verrucomicrobiae bacterium]|jgi:hypothetical protein
MKCKVLLTQRPIITPEDCNKDWFFVRMVVDRSDRIHRWLEEQHTNVATPRIHIREVKQE